MEEEAEMMTMMSEEDSFRSMAEEGVDRSYDEMLPFFRSEIARKLGKMERRMEPTAKRRLSAFSKLDWAEDLENSTVNVIKYMTANRDCCCRGAAHFAAKEPALAETLRRNAAWCDATLAELEEIAAAARRLRGMCLSMLKEATEEDIVCVAAAEYLLAHAATCTSHDGSSIPVFPYEEAVADQVDAAVAAGASASDLRVKRLVEWFAEMARSLRRGAAELGGEDAVKLMERAAKVEALCADTTQALLQKMVSSSYWESWRILIGREAAPGAQTPMDEDDTTPLFST